MKGILIALIFCFVIGIGCNPFGSVDENKISEDSIALDSEADSLLQAASAEMESEPDTIEADTSLHN